MGTGQCLITVDHIVIAMSYPRIKAVSLKPFHVLTKVFYNAISEFLAWVATVGTPSPTAMLLPPKVPGNTMFKMYSEMNN